MPKFGIIENELIVNVIIADQEFIDLNYPEAVEVPDHINRGDSFIDGEFIRHPGVKADYDFDA